MPTITPFLMFEGKAEEAMNFYTSLFPNSHITSIIRYGANEAGEEGSVMQATFTLNGQKFMCIDSNVKHDFTFTPSLSFYVTLETDAQMERIFSKLSQDGHILMPLGAYPFSKKFAWVADRYGVSWQLHLEEKGD